MNREERSVAVSESITSAGGWGLRYPGLVMGKGSKNEVKEFTGMWGLKSGADLVAFTDTLSREVPVWGGPGKTFSEATTMLGLIRTARWFVARTQDFDGYALFFISQFDGSLDKYFDDFVLNGKENLTKIWGQCVGCPSGPDATASDIVEYIARGQIKTLACYDVFPSLSLGQIYKAADWYEKTQKFQRAVAKGEGKLEDMVTAFFGELAESYKQVPSDAMIDTEVGHQWQYEDVAEHIGK
ncbi:MULTISPECIES: hypothetical protein [Rhizobium]|uniref:Uncharacterized protein n=1 Tax=Rhizobium favelukesii TaxID=348824 RepID=W6RNI5_9HYPH|nr:MULTISPECIES: hypothetical protein [Rhizobium]MCA0801346.1 hypothetical protein [Rhizobium sp. T1473]MCS0457816.1 hypothetical protein [Rhizobium favelukesii]UFS80462.1 hypothetical protein LPB79_04320 [Rhizobium sp. T136]CDM62304.1 hypothetical protein LPU83_pLPU83d_0934 [Rhizobium favelukesii]